MKITGNPFVDKFILKLIWQGEVPRITKATLKKKREKIRIITISNVKAYNLAAEITTVWHWSGGRHLDRWHRIENAEIDPHSYGHLIFSQRNTSQ